MTMQQDPFSIASIFGGDESLGTPQPQETIQNPPGMPIWRPPTNGGQEGIQNPPGMPVPPRGQSNPYPDSSTMGEADASGHYAGGFHNIGMPVPQGGVQQEAPQPYPNDPVPPHGALPPQGGYGQDPYDPQAQMNGWYNAMNGGFNGFDPGGWGNFYQSQPYGGGSYGGQQPWGGGGYQPYGGGFGGGWGQQGGGYGGGYQPYGGGYGQQGGGYGGFGGQSYGGGYQPYGGNGFGSFDPYNGSFGFGGQQGGGYGGYQPYGGGGYGGGYGHGGGPMSAAFQPYSGGYGGGWGQHPPGMPLPPWAGSGHGQQPGGGGGEGNYNASMHAMPLPPWAGTGHGPGGPPPAPIGLGGEADASGHMGGTGPGQQGTLPAPAPIGSTGPSGVVTNAPPDFMNPANLPPGIQAFGTPNGQAPVAPSAQAMHEMSPTDKSSLSSYWQDVKGVQPDDMMQQVQDLAPKAGATVPTNFG